jgi:arginyl-tRNA synthetase
VVKVFEENVLPYFRKFNSSDFRWQRLWNEPCDIVLKKNLKTLKEIYAKHSGRESVPGEPKHMCMNEFIDLVTMSGVIDDNFGAREISVLFNLSMMT